MQQYLLNNFSELMNSLEIQTRRDGSKPTPKVKLLAVSKTRSAEEIQQLASLGQKEFGENRPQELLGKIPLVQAPVNWHLIGPLQSNKVRKIIGKAAVIQSVHSLALLTDIQRISMEMGFTQKIFLQVNIGNDPAKQGFAESEVAAAVDACQNCPNIALGGFMTIPAYHDDPEKSRPDFAALRELRDRVAASAGTEIPELSMGMSHDYKVAIEEGSTMVRIGSSLFGARQPPAPLSDP